MDRLTGKESSYLMEAYSSIYNKDKEEINEGLLDRAALQPLKQAAKTELKRLGSQALNKYVPMLYKSTLGGAKETLNTAISPFKTAFKYTVGSKGALRNPFVQAGLAADAAVRQGNSLPAQAYRAVAAPVGQAVKKVKKVINPTSPPPSNDPWEQLDAKESNDLFDSVKDYLVNEGYAATEQQAIVIMANMGESWKNNIIEDITKN